MSKKPLRKITLKVTPQTAYNLGKLAAMAGYKTTGQAVDKLVREKMLALKETEVR